MRIVGHYVGSFAVSSGSALNELCNLISCSHCFLLVFRFSSNLRTGLLCVFCWKLPPSSFLRGVLVPCSRHWLVIFPGWRLFFCLCRACSSIYKVCFSFISYFYWCNLHVSTFCRWAFTLHVSHVRLSRLHMRNWILQGWEFFYSFRLCLLLCEHNLQKRWTASYSGGPLNIASKIAEGVNFSPMTCRRVYSSLPCRAKLQRVLCCVPVLPAIVIDVRHLPSDFPEVLAEHAISREHLGHPVGEREVAAVSPCLLIWENRLLASIIASLVDQLGSPLVPRVLLGDS